MRSVAAFEAAPKEPAIETPTFSMGEPTVPLDGALRLAADLEDEELVRRLGIRPRAGGPSS
jgi:hypothetical protein